MFLFLFVSLCGFAGKWSVYVGIPRAHYDRSDITIKQPALSRDLTFYDVSSYDDPRFDRVKGKYFDQIQLDTRLTYWLNEDLGYELVLNHITYIVDTSRTAAVSGRFDSPVGGTQNINRYVTEYEHSNGLNLLLVSRVAALYRRDLGSQFVLSVFYHLAAGFSITNSNVEIYDQEGNRELTDNKAFVLAGPAATLGGRIEIKRGAWGLTLLPEFLWTNIHRAVIPQGTAAQHITARVWSLGLNYHF